jgi:hypothetical protein
MRWLIGIVIGAAVGFAWYKFSGGGCTTNTCPMTSNPWISTLWGAVMGALLTSK